VTIDTAQIFFKTVNRDYTIIDAPGHREFLKNMITGSTQAEAGVLMIDAVEGLAEQTHRHALILGLLGIKQILVPINKMDLIGYSQEHFDGLKNRIIARLGEFGIEARSEYVIPISAKLGDNIAYKGGNLSWHKGPTLLEALDQLQPARSAEANVLRLPLQDIYDVSGEKVLVGRIASGVLHEGERIVFQPSGVSASVKGIRKFGEQPSKAVAGESIGLLLEKDDADETLERGQIACTPDDFPDRTDTIEAPVFWMSEHSVRKGDTLEFRCATMQTSCRIEEITGRLDSATFEPINEDPDELRDTEVARLTIKTDRCVAVDPFEKVAETGRFVLMRDKNTVAGGVLHEGAGRLR
jgi:sulfate adenylyltransferase subunit 1 (EFTu-like GTPase family)